MPITLPTINKLRLNTDSPFLKGNFDNPLKGAHLSWITVVSDAMQGSCGNGKVNDDNGNAIGKFKAFGGLVTCTLAITGGTTASPKITNIIMPCNPFNRAPVLFSDGQVAWGTKINNSWTVSITTTSDVDGYCTYMS